MNLVCRLSTLVALSVCLAACSQPSPAPVKPQFTPGTTVDFEFETQGNVLSGVFDIPDQTPKALMLFVHGYGETDVRGWQMYAELRRRFNQIGIATATWDKPGLGRSQGSFDINQPVADSAREVVDAAQYLRQLNAPGAHYIGIWGVSRAGWIAPIALAQDGNLKFWISVSGVTAEDNFTYLLLSNLPYEGGTPEQALHLAAEWRAGCAVFRNGGSYQEYQAVTQTLRANPYIKRMRGEWPDLLQYSAQQASCSEGVCANVDDDMCSYIHIKDFDGMLSSLNVDVLAMFGEKDLNVDWRKTIHFYQQTIGQNPQASLAIKTFPDADHNLNVAQTGSIKEMQTMQDPHKSGGYYEQQVEWLKTHVLSVKRQTLQPIHP